MKANDIGRIGKLENILKSFRGTKENAEDVEKI